MRNQIIIYITSILIILTSKVSAHGMQDWMGGIAISTPVQYEFQHHRLYSGVNVNMFFLFWNMSFEHISHINGNDNKFNYHLGFGLLSYLQIQYGFNNKLRLRSDLVLFGTNSPLFSSVESGWSIFRKGIVITPYIDVSLKKISTSRIGFSLGLQI